MKGDKYILRHHNLREGGFRSVLHNNIDNAICYIDESTLTVGEEGLFRYEADFDPEQPIHTILTSTVESIEWSEDGTLTVSTKNTEYVFERMS